jgi:hypothetical protein
VLILLAVKSLSERDAVFHLVYTLVAAHRLVAYHALADGSLGGMLVPSSPSSGFTRCILSLPHLLHNSVAGCNDIAPVGLALSHVALSGVYHLRAWVF